MTQTQLHSSEVSVLPVVHPILSVSKYYINATYSLVNTTANKYPLLVIGYYNYLAAIGLWNLYPGTYTP